jgi:hypothetical protein
MKYYWMLAGAFVLWVALANGFAFDYTAIAVFFALKGALIFWLVLKALTVADRAISRPAVMPSQVACPDCGAQEGYYCSTAPNTPHHWHLGRRAAARNMTWYVRAEANHARPQHQVRSHEPAGRVVCDHGCHDYCTHSRSR